MLFKVISLSNKTGSASFFNSSSGRTALKHPIYNVYIYIPLYMRWFEYFIGK